MHVPADNPGTFEPVTAESALNACCGHLLTTSGLASLYRERASQINAMPVPPVRPYADPAVTGRLGRDRGAEHC
jgi:hypothetical protein